MMKSQEQFLYTIILLMVLITYQVNSHHIFLHMYLKPYYEDVSLLLVLHEYHLDYLAYPSLEQRYKQRKEIHSSNSIQKHISVELHSHLVFESKLIVQQAIH